MLRTGHLLRPASNPASRPRTGASLPGTLASPRTGLAPAGCPQLVAWLRHHNSNLLVVMASKLLDALPDVPFRAHETLASSKVAGWASPAHITFAGDRRDWGWRGMSAHPESAFCARHSSTGGWPQFANVAGRGTSFVVHSRCRANPSASVLEHRALDLLRPLVTDSCQRCRIPQGKSFAPKGEHRLGHRLARRGADLLGLPPQSDGFAGRCTCRAGVVRLDLNCVGARLLPGHQFDHFGHVT